MLYTVYFPPYFDKSRYLTPLLHSSQNQTSGNVDESNPKHSKWNHWYGHASFSQKTISSDSDNGCGLLQIHKNARSGGLTGTGATTTCCAALLPPRGFFPGTAAAAAFFLVEARVDALVVGVGNGNGCVGVS